MTYITLAFILIIYRKTRIRNGCGFLKPAAAVATGNIPDIVRAVYLEYTVLRSSQEIGQFIEGLQTVGIATLMKRHPLVIKKLFVYNGAANVTAQYLSELLVPIFSPRGHNQREEEEAVVLNWRDYIITSLYFHVCIIHVLPFHFLLSLSWLYIHV